MKAAAIHTLISPSTKKGSLSTSQLCVGPLVIGGGNPVPTMKFLSSKAAVAAMDSAKKDTVQTSQSSIYFYPPKAQLACHALEISLTYLRNSEIRTRAVDLLCGTNSENICPNWYFKRIPLSSNWIKQAWCRSVGISDSQRIQKCTSLQTLAGLEICSPSGSCSLRSFFLSLSPDSEESSIFCWSSCIHTEWDEISHPISQSNSTTRTLGQATRAFSLHFPTSTLCTHAVLLVDLLIWRMFSRQDLLFLHDFKDYKILQGSQLTCYKQMIYEVTSFQAHSVQNLKPSATGPRITSFSKATLPLI